LGLKNNPSLDPAQCGKPTALGSNMDTVKILANLCFSTSPVHAAVGTGKEATELEFSHCS